MLVCPGGHVVPIPIDLDMDGLSVSRRQSQREGRQAHRGHDGAREWIGKQKHAEPHPALITPRDDLHPRAPSSLFADRYSGERADSSSRSSRSSRSRSSSARVRQTVVGSVVTYYYDDGQDSDYHYGEFSGGAGVHQQIDC